jgi:microcystin-dependent protein
LFPTASLGTQDALERQWPVGSIFTSTVTTDPAELLGFGVWEQFAAGRVLVGLDAGQSEFDTLEETGGAKTHTLTVNEMPSHTHVQNAHNHVQNAAGTATGGLVGSTPDASTNNSTASGYSTANATAVNQNTGGGAAHNNLQPFLVVIFWRRTG